MLKVLVIQSIHDDGMALLKARHDLRYEIVDGNSAEVIQSKIADADGVTIRTACLSAEILDCAQRLKVVSRHGVGFDNIDLDALNRRGIPLALTVDANATSVAEHVLFMMLHLAKQGGRYDRATRDGSWHLRNSLDAVDLAERRVLILGFGRIGKEVAALCKAFRMQISVYDPFIPADIVREAGYRMVNDIADVLAETDILTVHMPLTEGTRNLISTSAFQALPQDAFVINCARGGIVDEKALYGALTSGEIAGAGLDVFEQEPPRHDHPLLGLENVVLSPHSAGLTLESARRMAVSTARNVLAGIDGRLDPAMVINQDVL